MKTTFATAGKICRRVSIAAVVLAVVAAGVGWRGAWGERPAPPGIRVSQKLPLSFEANHGQADPVVRFLSRGSGYSLFLTSTGAVLALSQRDAPRGAAVAMQFVGSNPHAAVSGREPQPGTINYFVGRDPARWRSGIPTYAKVAYSDLYPDVDLVYYGYERQLEYDFVVQPGGDPADIVVSFQGADSLTLDDNGDLVLETATGEVRHRKPFIYQESDGVRQQVDGGYRLTGAREVRFTLARYDTSRPLVIDPVLDYATYLGGSSPEQGWDIAVDTGGYAYVTGFTSSADFPTSLGAFDTTHNGGTDAFVTKLNSAGSALEYSTYLGGSLNDGGFDIAVDTAGNAYVTGVTLSANFPATPGAFDTTYNGGGNADAFVVKLNADGSLGYATYLGGSGNEHGRDIAVDAVGNAYLTGFTQSVNFPTTPAAFDTTFNGEDDAFVTKLNFIGSALDYSTFLGGSSGDNAQGIAVDPGGNAYVAGSTASVDFPTTSGAFDTTFGGGDRDAFVTKLNSIGAALDYSTFLGGTLGDFAQGIAVDPGDNAYAAGFTVSVDFPTTSGAFDTTFNGGARDAFVTKLNPTGSGLMYSTYLGGSSLDSGRGIAVDTDGNAHVTGDTSSVDFPTTPGAIDTTYGNSGDAFMAKLNLLASGLVYSTYLGGSTNDLGSGIAVDTIGNAYVMGETSSANFPVTPGAFDTTFNGGFLDAFVVNIGLLPTAADQCRKGGWQTFGVFKNQGDCVSFVSTGGQNSPSLP